MEDICPCKHDNNLRKKFIFINNLYKFPLVLCHVFFLLPLFTDIFNAASLFNLGLVLTDVFEVLSVPLSECRKSQATLFFLLTRTAMNEKCFLQFIISSAAQFSLYNFDCKLSIVLFLLANLFCASVYQLSISNVSSSPRGHFPVMLSRFGQLHF